AGDNDLSSEGSVLLRQFLARPVNAIKKGGSASGAQLLYRLNQLFAIAGPILNYVGLCFYRNHKHRVACLEASAQEPGGASDNGVDAAVLHGITCIDDQAYSQRDVCAGPDLKWRRRVLVVHSRGELGSRCNRNNSPLFVEREE